jgi:hypothetical protein
MKKLVFFTKCPLMTGFRCGQSPLWTGFTVFIGTQFFFGLNLFEMGESAQLNFAPKIFGRNFADLGEFPPNQKFLAGHWDETRPNQKKFAHKFSGEQELLCT